MVQMKAVCSEVQLLASAASLQFAVAILRLRSFSIGTMTESGTGTGSRELLCVQFVLDFVVRVQVEWDIQKIYLFPQLSTTKSEYDCSILKLMIYNLKFKDSLMFDDGT